MNLDPLKRCSTSLSPLDHVLGGGLVEASVVLLASSAGVGKTSLTLQALKGLGYSCLYASGEETQEQIANTARRLGATSPQVYVLAAQRLEKILAQAREMRAKAIAIDTIQKIACEDASGRAGSPGQIQEMRGAAGHLRQGERHVRVVGRARHQRWRRRRASSGRARR
jgi:DNA repair protein RadA/Sms